LKNSPRRKFLRKIIINCRFAANIKQLFNAFSNLVKYNQVSEHTILHTNTNTLHILYDNTKNRRHHTFLSKANAQTTHNQPQPPQKTNSPHTVKNL
jgi:hypothetical protein